MERIKRSEDLSPTGWFHWWVFPVELVVFLVFRASALQDPFVFKVERHSHSTDCCIHWITFFRAFSLWFCSGFLLWSGSMPADLSIPFQLCRTLKYILPGEDTVSSEPAPDLDQRTLQTLFPLQCFIINEQVHLVESIVLVDTLGDQTKPAKQ